MQNNVKYEVVGISNAPEFFRVVENTGEIRIKDELIKDKITTEYRVSITTNNEIKNE